MRDGLKLMLLLAVASALALVAILTVPGLLMLVLDGGP